MLLVWTKLSALAALAFVAGSGPAFATMVTHTFAGTVTASDSIGDVTTKDIGKEFGNSAASSSVNDSFTLTAAIDASKYGVSQPDFNINGGTYYSGTPGDIPISDALSTVPLPPSLLLLAPGLFCLLAARKTI